MPSNGSNQRLFMSYQYGSIEGEEYSVPILSLEDYGWPGSSTSSTVESSECNDLLDDRHEQSVPVNMLFFQKSLGDSLYHLLGFKNDPLLTDEGPPDVRNSASADLRLSLLSNFSTAYNVISISLCLHIMDRLYPATTNDESLCSSALIAGMIVGQLAGGALGDMLGRHRAMTLVMCLQVLASLASAFSTDVTVPFIAYRASIYQILALWRFVLGLGCGGVYPLAATLTAESSQSAIARAKSVALTFAFQGVGYLAVPLLAWIVVSIIPEPSDLAWRTLLGFGAIPGILLTFKRSWNMHRRQQGLNIGTESSMSDRSHRHGSFKIVPVSVWNAIRAERDLVRKLIGTGGCWLIFDVLFYGNTLFQPVVLAEAFGAAETVKRAAQDTFLISCMAMPGYIISIFAVGRQSPRFIQIQGFFMMGILYLTIGILFDSLRAHKSALLIVYGSTFFFSNYGPNSTTFMLPSMTFSKPCRSTLNGVCAACGKTGALIGSVVFVRASEHFGQEAVFLACGLLSFIGCFVTLLCVNKNVGLQDEQSINLSDLDPEDIEALRSQMGSMSLKIVMSEPSLLDFGR